jgi:hypothetical protein
MISISDLGFGISDWCMKHEVKSEPQNIEQEISNDEVWNRFTQSFFK